MIACPTNLGLSRNRTRNLGLLFLVVLTAPFVFAQKTLTTFDKNFDFSGHQRYAWRQNHLLTHQHPDTNEMMDLKIVKAVNQTLIARGFVEVKDKPDFYIYYDGGSDMQLSAGGKAQANSTPLSPVDRAPTYGLGNGPALAPATWLKVNGQIEFYMTDEPGKILWQTTYNKTFRDPNKALRNLDKEVSELVSKSFKDFPPNAKK
ncbi:MAG TPA: DUF4136 domain-containing protein [Candidatus Sulfotelmatobacter sp.]|nr:DUF4136 domain-containing protein [Candidatus Sulfotelmatobacter sp.]